MEKAIKRSRNLYILEAALEYLISILMTGSFLATLTGQLGIPDNITGIISNFVTLGFVFQFFSVFIHPKKSKPLVLILSVANQLLFTLLYIIPLSGNTGSLYTALFVATILLAYVLYNIAYPKKINWFMSLVDDKERGKFTANKEIISLILGMIFSFSMGAVVDYFKEKNDIQSALIICAITVFILIILHTLTMVFSVEKPTEISAERTSFLKNFAALIKDKNIIKVALLFVIWNIANSATTPFLHTYKLKDLGLSLTVITIITALGSFARILISIFWGKYADQHSFAKMDMLCFGVAAISFLFIVFSGPENKYITIIGYNVFYAAALGGINSSMINLIFDLVEEHKRSDSLALTQIASGIFAFVTSLAVSPFIDFVQKNDNHIMGFHLYAQQITAVFSVILTVTAIIYIWFAFVKPKKQ